MRIDVGDKLPVGEFLRLNDGGIETVYLSDLATARTVVIFGVPGAYTGVCTTAHVPSFIKAKDDLMAAGVDEIICVSVNDPFVMDAWADSTGAKEAGITMLGDPSGAFIKDMKLNFDGPGAGLFGRSHRFALVAADGIVKMISVQDNPGECDVSTGQAIVEALTA